MGALIDSSVLIAAERGDLDLELQLRNYEDEDLAISAVTASELLHGVHRARRTKRRAQREAYVEALISAFPVLPFDLLAARLHARLAAASAGRGETIGAHDLVIAATALSRGLDIVTRDTRSFPRIQGIETVVW